MILFEKRNENGEIVSRSTDPAVSYIHYKKKDVSTPTGILTLYTNDSDLIKSSRLFNKVAVAIASFIDTINDYFLKHIEVHLHSLKKIHAQQLGKIESIVPNPLLNAATSYQEQRTIVLEQIKNNPEKVTEALLFMKKRIFELGAHMYSFEILHMGKHLHIDKQPHNIRQLILSVWHGFDDETTKKGLRYQFLFDESLAKRNKIILDYKTINAALYNFFDNAIKYTKQNSVIRFHLNVNEENFKLIIDMHSIKIEHDELKRAFMLGYRGVNVIKYGEGTGVGLYIVKKAFDLNDLSIVIEPDYSNVISEGNNQYVLNRFVISGSLTGIE